jgi:hypothetical protein
MKSVLSLGVILTMFILLGSLPNSAKAVAASHAGSICRGSTSIQQAFLVNEPYGVVNTSTTSSAVIVCPLVRTSTGSSVSVYVDGYLLANGQAITCVLYSFDYSGNLLGSQYFSSPKGGTFDIYASVPSANVWSTATVECTLPPAELPNANYPAIFDVDVVE